jgi:hypothetical protein
MFVPFVFGQGGESRDIDEGEAAMDSHRTIVTRRWSNVSIATSAHPPDPSNTRPRHFGPPSRAGPMGDPRRCPG